MNYVFDTNVILYYLKDAQVRAFIETTYAPFREGNNAIVSIVTIGEIMALAQKNNWGVQRLGTVEKMLAKLVVVEVRYGKLLELYAEIEAFSQGKLTGKSVAFSARNMGKNDVWIAATTVLTNAKLITADKDFNHLDGIFFDIIAIGR